MKRIFLILLIISGTPSFGQLSLRLSPSSLPADSIFFSNITQDREFQFIPYAQLLDIKLNEPLNDLYNLTFYTGQNKKMNQLWLDGESVVIKGTFTGKALEIDTVIGSDLYYTSIDFRTRFYQLMEQPTDSTVINDFLMNELKKNINNSFSIEISRNFFNRNSSRKDELRKIRSLLAGQNQAIRDHLLNPYRKIENLLTRNKIELAKFKFYTPEGKLEPLTTLKNKRYLIDMWFIGCAPCLEQHKEIAATLAVLTNNNIDVIGISIDRNQHPWKDFIQAKRYSWLNVRETEELEKQLRTDMLIDSYPTYFLIDGKGTILHRTNSFREMTTYLKL
jgi:peroxiredoxin